VSRTLLIFYKKTTLSVLFPHVLLNLFPSN